MPPKILGVKASARAPRVQPKQTHFRLSEGLVVSNGKSKVEIMSPHDLVRQTLDGCIFPPLIGNVCDYLGLAPAACWVSEKSGRDFLFEVDHQERLVWTLDRGIKVYHVNSDRAPGWDGSKRGSVWNFTLCVHGPHVVTWGGPQELKTAASMADADEDDTPRQCTVTEAEMKEASLRLRDQPPDIVAVRDRTGRLVRTLYKHEPETWSRFDRNAESADEDFMILGLAANDDRVYLASGADGVQVLEMDGSGMRTFVQGGRGKHKIQWAYAVAVDSDDHSLAVADARGFIKVFDRKGDLMTRWAIPKTCFRDYDSHRLLAVKRGLYFVLDKSVVHIYKRDGTKVLTLGSQGEFEWPTGLHVDDFGFLYVADTTSQSPELRRLQIFALPPMLVA